MGDIRKNENDFLENRHLYEGTWPTPDEPMPEEECADRSARRKAVENGAELEQPSQVIIHVNTQHRCPMCGREYPPNLFQRHNCPAVYESVRRRGGGPMGV